MNATAKINHSFELADKLRSLKASVHKEASLIKTAMHEEMIKSVDSKDMVNARYAKEFSRLWAWESHLQKLIENEHSCSGFPQNISEEPEGEPMPRSRRRNTTLLRDELEDGTNDPLFDLMAQFFGASFVLGMAKTSNVKDSLLTLRVELENRMKPAPKVTTTTVVTSAQVLKPRKPAPGRLTGKPN